MEEKDLIKPIMVMALMIATISTMQSVMSSMFPRHNWKCNSCGYTWYLREERGEIPITPYCPSCGSMDVVRIFYVGILYHSR